VGHATPSAGHSARRSNFQAIKQPLGADSLAPKFFDAPAKCAIRRHQDRMVCCVSRESNERVVALGGSVDHGHSVGDTFFDAAPSGSFENHHNRIRETAVARRRANTAHKRARRTWPIFPPASRARTDHVRRVNQQHDGTLVHPALDQAR
jgi:hypothetical protein